MTSVIPARRRAEEFAAQVDGRTDGRSTRPVRADDARAELLELVAALRAVPEAAPRPEFVADLRSRLMVEADVALRPVDTRLALPAHARSRRDRRLAAAAGAIALVGGGTSVAVAAQSALPGDALYPIKRILESVQTTVQTDDDARATQMLDIAADRLAEVSAVAELGTTEGDAALPQALDDFSTQSATAADLVLAEYAEDGEQAPVEQLREFASRSMDTLAVLDALVPASARESLNTAAQTLTLIDERARAACPTCGGDLIEIPTSLLAAFTSATEQREVAPETVLDAGGEADGTTTGPGPAPKGADKGDDGGDEPLVSQPPLLEEGGADGGGQTGDGGGSTDDQPSLRDLTDLLISSGGSDQEKKTDDEEDEGVLDPVVDPLLDPITGEDGLLDE